MSCHEVNAKLPSAHLGGMRIIPYSGAENIASAKELIASGKEAHASNHLVCAFYTDSRKAALHLLETTPWKPETLLRISVIFEFGPGPGLKPPQPAIAAQWLQKAKQALTPKMMIDGAKDKTHWIDLRMALLILALNTKEKKEALQLLEAGPWMPEKMYQIGKRLEDPLWMQKPDPASAAQWIQDAKDAGYTPPVKPKLADLPKKV